MLVYGGTDPGPNNGMENFRDFSKITEFSELKLEYPSSI